MDILNQLIENFKSSSAKFLVLFSALGIAISTQAVYHSINNNIEEKLELLNKWEEKHYKDVPTQYMEMLYEQVLHKLQESDKDGGHVISLLSQRATYFPLKTLVFKFLTGGILYLFIYGLQMLSIIIRSKKYSKPKVSTIDLLKRNVHLLYVWLILSLTNMAIPMLTTPINYVFIPSCLTLLYAISEIICKEAGNGTPINKKIDTSGLY